MFRAREALRQCLPEALKDQTFYTAIKGEESVQRWLVLLVKNLSDNPGPIATIAAQPAGAAKAGAAGAAAAPGGLSSGGVFGYSGAPLASANWSTN